MLKSVDVIWIMLETLNDLLNFLLNLSHGYGTHTHVNLYESRTHMKDLIKNLINHLGSIAFFTLFTYILKLNRIILNNQAYILGFMQV